MTSFVDSYEYQSLLDIAKRNRDAIDTARVTTDGVVGVDNYSRLMISTVFSAIAIEAALNDYTLIHCNFLDFPYLEGVFRDITTDFLRGNVHKKIELVRNHWPDKIPAELIKEVKELIRIRNRIAHQSGQFIPSFESDTGGAMMTNRPLTGNDMLHMLKHHDIAHDFLSRFWLPGNGELTSRRPKEP